MTKKIKPIVNIADYNLIAKEHTTLRELRERITQQEKELEHLRQTYRLMSSQTPDIVAATYHTVGQLVDDYATVATIPDVALQAVTALQMVIQERRRQIAVEGFNTEHDDKYKDDELARAAASYAIPEDHRTTLSPWPFDYDWFKPSNDKRDIVKAAALLLAELERRLRAETTSK